MTALGDSAQSASAALGGAELGGAELSGTAQSASARPASAELGSILLGSADPARLRAWYCAALHPVEIPDGFLDFGGMRVLIDGRSDVGAANPEPGRVILNFHVADAAATARRLDKLGVTWLSPVERRGGNLFGTLIDPDGNYIQIIQLRPQPQPHA